MALIHDMINDPSNYRIHEIYCDGKVYPSTLVKRCGSMEELQHTLNQQDVLPKDGTITIKQGKGANGEIFYKLKILYTLPPELRRYRRRYTV